MAPEQIVVRLTVVPDVSSREQLETTPPDSPKRIVAQFLSHLATVKRNLKCHCAEPLEFEPERLDQTCLNCLAEARWRKRAGYFYRGVYPEALTFAEAVLESREEAEDAVQDAFLTVFTGESLAKHFFRRLKFKCKDRLKKKSPESFDAWEQAEEELGEWADDAFERSDGSETAEQFEGAVSAEDPVEVLISRKDYQHLRCLIERAREIASTDRKYRWIKRKDWAKPLNLGRK